MDYGQFRENVEIVKFCPKNQSNIVHNIVINLISISKTNNSNLKPILVITKPVLKTIFKKQSALPTVVRATDIACNIVALSCNLVQTQKNGKKLLFYEIIRG